MGDADNFFKLGMLVSAGDGVFRVRVPTYTGISSVAIFFDVFEKFFPLLHIFDGNSFYTM